MNKVDVNGLETIGRNEYVRGFIKKMFDDRGAGTPAPSYNPIAPNK